MTAPQSRHEWAVALLPWNRMLQAARGDRVLDGRLRVAQLRIGESEDQSCGKRVTIASAVDDGFSLN